MMLLLFVTLTSMLLAADHEPRRVAHRRRRTPPVGGAHRRARGGDPRPRRCAARAARATISSCGRAAAHRPAPICLPRHSRVRRARWPTVVAAGVFVVAAAAALVIVLSGGSGGTTHASNQAPAVVPPPVPALPLELVALGHERDGERLIVRGIVRNPASGAAVGSAHRRGLPVQPRRRIPVERPRRRRNARRCGRAPNPPSSSPFRARATSTGTE